MSCLHRACARIAFSLSLAFLPISSPTSVSAQQVTSPAGQSTRQEERASADSILLTVTVTDKKGNYIGGLDKSAFTIYDNKIPQEISFFSAQDEPLSVGVIFDLSRSVTNMNKELLVAAGEAFLRFVKLSHSSNEYFVIGFATRPQLLIDWTRGDKILEEAASKLSRLSAEGGTTALYDACYLGIEKMRSSSYSKQAILLISDGADSISDYTFKDVRERLKEMGVPLYSIGILRNIIGATVSMEGYAVMEELSSVSGGAAVFPDDKKKINAAFDQLAIELRHQYRIGFKPPTDKADGKWHQLKIKVIPPPNAPASMSNLSARSRSGYYAPKTLR